ncbi:MAG: DUF1772 domain-containing protein [Vicinamibacterales bacterium]
MNDSLMGVVTYCVALACGLMAGVFFAFSAFIMKALARVAPAHGIVAMQSINVFAVTPLFMTVLFGTAVACLVLAVSSILNWQRASAVYVFAGCLLYLVGTILVTIVFNVPRNNALAAVDPNSADGARLWADYVSSWTAWNHVRTVAALGASALLTLA